MAVVVGTKWQAGAAALATLVGALGLLAAPPAGASQSRQPRTVAPTWQRGTLLPGPVSRSGFASFPARSLWGPGGLAHLGLPRLTAPVRGSASGGWTLQPTPNPATLRNASLVADSCSAAGACTAIGTDVNAAGATVTLAERQLGSSWKVQRTPAITGAADSLLSGVSCAAAKACIAVGYSYSQSGRLTPLAEGWNGTRWLVQPTKSIGLGSQLFAVSCTSATACTAVGTYFPNSTNELTLAERWNGTRWSIQSTPEGASAVASELLGVSCSAAKACTAVGASADSSGTSTPLAMGWSGSPWTLQTAPAPAGSQESGLSAVSCTAGACIAAGSYISNSGNTLSLAERWNGTNWATKFVPRPVGAVDTELLTVSCTSGNTCTAGGAWAHSGNAGTVVTLAETWNGSSWQVQATPNPAHITAGGFAGLSCIASGGCAAVGSYGTSATLADLALAEARRGTTWKEQASASPAGANPSQLGSVSCTTVRHCVAVGFYTKNTLVTETLAETWNGSHWRIAATPQPATGITSGFNAISCPSALSCVAVGGTAKGIGNEKPLAETLNGSKWTVRNVPAPAHNSGVSLNSVSCTAPGACTAVGNYDTHSGNQIAVAERWNGAKWTIQKLPSVAPQTTFGSVTCTAERACIAVGFLLKGSGDAQPLIEAWNGSSWRVQHVLLPKGSPGDSLAGVSCSAAKDCTATGSGFGSNGEPLAERWNGTKWTVQATVPAPNFQESTSEVGLIAVSCSSARTCTAVGNDTPNNQVESFGEGWNGVKWSLQPTAAPIVSQGNFLSGLSCPSPKCIAVGGFIAFSGIAVTMAESRSA